ncbi:RelA/SpoT domain-containing protein [Shewanella waksmanii]|uniref:RelA/SpoT domain-containing protein n=1 Tax=Shewanella waksmanii TaxID=213783 RepID=UPI003735ED13
MNKLFRTFSIFLLLLSTRSAFATPVDIQAQVKEANEHYVVRQSLNKDLDGLLSIPSQSFLTRQFSGEIDELYLHAPEAQSELLSMLEGLTDSIPGEIISPDIKSYARAQQKISNKFDGDASQLTDIVRASVVSHNIADLVSVYEGLSHKAKIVQVKNRFAAPKESGYRDINLLVKLPDSNMIAEVQLHLAAIAEIKSGDEHLVYEQIQQIEQRAKQQARPTSEFENQQITQLRQDSHKLYHKAWLQYKRIDRATLLTPQAA